MPVSVDLDRPEPNQVTSEDCTVIDVVVSRRSRRRTRGITVDVDYSSVPHLVHFYGPVVFDYYGLISEEPFLCLERRLLGVLLLSVIDISTVSVV